jgi:hypothetical protein
MEAGGPSMTEDLVILAVGAVTWRLTHGDPALVLLWCFVTAMFFWYLNRIRNRKDSD